MKFFQDKNFAKLYSTDLGHRPVTGNRLHARALSNPKHYIYIHDRCAAIRFEHRHSKLSTLVLNNSAERKVVEDGDGLDLTISVPRCIKAFGM